MNGRKSLTEIQGELKKAAYNGSWYLSAILAAYTEPRTPPIVTTTAMPVGTSPASASRLEMTSLLS